MTCQPGLVSYSFMDLLIVQKRRCVYCGKFMKLKAKLNHIWAATIEHVCPRSETSVDSHYNRVLACSNCNSARRSYCLTPKQALKCRYTILAAYACALTRTIELASKKNRNRISRATELYAKEQRRVHAKMHRNARVNPT